MSVPESMKLPLVSIMMPARNAALNLRATITSIQNQTYRNWELVFVDDGSTDNTLDLIRELAVNDGRIRIFPMPFGGRGRARNTCVENMRGELVAVCDADDVSFPERFQKQVDYLLEHPEIGAVGSWWVPFVNEVPKSNKPIRTFPTDPAALREAFKNGKMRFHNATVMLRASLFSKYGAYNIHLRRAQDYEFFSRLSKNGVQFAAMPEPLLYYRQDNLIPSIKYFRENGIFMAFADRILAGDTQSFDSFEKSVLGRIWHTYYTIKYVYFYAKISMVRMLEANSEPH